MRILVASIILAAVLAAPAGAGVEAVARIERPPAWICALVRQQLAAFGGNRRELEKAARERGYTESQIRAGRLCR